MQQLPFIIKYKLKHIHACKKMQTVFDNSFTKFFYFLWDEWFSFKEYLLLFTHVRFNVLQAIEFVQFKERLQHSSQYSLAKIESHILQLKQNSVNLETIEVLKRCCISLINQVSVISLQSYFFFFCRLFLMIQKESLMSCQMCPMRLEVCLLLSMRICNYDLGGHHRQTKITFLVCFTNYLFNL